MKKFSIISLLLLFLICIPVYADKDDDKKAHKPEIEDVSISHELMSPVVVYKKNNGFAFDTNGDSEENARKIAEKLIKSLDKTSGVPNIEKYSLYERFGSDIHWYRYLGEVTYSIQLADHIYSAYEQGKLNKLRLGETIFYKTNKYLSCNVYPNRPRVLSNEECMTGKVDPRVLSYSISRFDGYRFVSGSFFMSIAKGITSLVSMLCDTDIQKNINYVVDKITNPDFWNVFIIPVVNFLLGFAIIFFIFSLTRKAVLYGTGRGSSPREFIKRFLVGFICLGLIFTSLYYPTAFNNIFYKTTTLIDEIFKDAIAFTYIEDDVIGSTSPDKVMEAAIWKSTIFEPWCIGQFGVPYDKLYTQYSNKPEDKKMKQSYLSEDDIDKLNDNDIYYNSAKYTGDIGVPVGNDIIVKNWAAFLYSCGSKFHIDSSYVTGIKKAEGEIVFPCYTSTANNKDIPADLFRIIDAQYNISPKIIKGGNEDFSYIDSHAPKTRFISQSKAMLFNSLVLFITFIPAIMGKLFNLFLLVFVSFQIVMRCVVEIYKEGEGVRYLFDDIKKHLINYFLFSLKLFLLISLYTTLIGTSLLNMLLYIFLSFVVYRLNYKKLKTEIKYNLPSRVKYYKDAIGRKF